MTPVEKDHARGLNGALAAEIRSELGAKDKSQSWLSEESGIERLTLRRYLKAERGMSTAVIEAIAAALELDPSDLMARAVRRRDDHPDLFMPRMDPAWDLDVVVVMSDKLDRQSDLSDPSLSVAAMDDDIEAGAPED